MSRSYPSEARCQTEEAAFVETCMLVLTLDTSEELVWLEHLEGVAGDDTGDITMATSKGCCTPRKRYQF